LESKDVLVVGLGISGVGSALRLANADVQRFARVAADFISDIKKLGRSLLQGDGLKQAKATDQAQGSTSPGSQLT